MIPCKAAFLVRAVPVLIAILALATAPLTGQPTPNPTFVTIPEVFPALDARAIVLRHGDRDIVVLHPADVSAEALATALSVLRKARDARPMPKHGEMMPITGYSYPDGLSQRTRRRMEAVLSELRDRPITEVGSLGPGRWLRFRGS